MENNEEQNNIHNDDIQNQMQSAAEKAKKFGNKLPKRKIKNKKTLGEKAGEIAGKGPKLAGAALKRTGQGLQATGKATKAAGHGVSAAGKGIKATGEGLKAAGNALSSTGIGAIVGAPLATVGSALSATGGAVDKAGKGVKKAGNAIDKQGAKLAKAGKKLEETGKNIENTVNSKIPQMPQIPNIGKIKLPNKGELVRKAVKKIFSKKLKILCIGVAIFAIFIILFIVLLVAGKTDDATDKPGDNTNVPYVVSSVVMNQITIVSNKSGGYAYAFQDKTGKILNLDEAIDEAIKTLKSNNSTALQILGTDDTKRKALLKQMLQAEIATQYPNLSSSEDLNYGAMPTETTTSVVGCDTNIDVTEKTNYITDVNKMKIALQSYNTSLADHAQDFIDFQNKYGINALFIASVSIWETSGGTTGHAIDGCNNWGNIKSREDPLAIGYITENSDNGETINWAKYPDAKTGIEAIYELIATRGPYIANGNKTISQIFLKYNPGDAEEPGKIANQMAKMYTSVGITNVTSTISTGAGTSIGAKTGEKKADIPADKSINGGITIQRKDENGNIINLKYTSTDNFDALLAQKDNNILNYYTLKRTHKSTSTLITSSYVTDGTEEGNAKVVWDFFINHGISAEATAGILGNITQESHFNPTASEHGNTGANGDGGYGLIQWTYGRRVNLFNTAQSQGTDVNSIEFQLNYLWNEVFAEDSNYRNQLEAAGYFSTKDPAEATYLFHKIVEVSADTQQQINDNRIEPAKKWYLTFNGTNTINVSNTASSNTASSNTASSNSASSNTASSNSKTNSTANEGDNESTLLLVVANKKDVNTTVTNSYEYQKTIIVEPSSGRNYSDPSQKQAQTPATENVSNSDIVTYTNTSVDYQSALKNYTLYFDFMWPILVTTENNKFVESWLNLVNKNSNTTNNVVITVYSSTTSNTTQLDEAAGSIPVSSGLKNGIAKTDYFQKTAHTTVATTELISKMAVTYADTWLLKYENNALNYDEYKGKSKEKITEKIDKNSTEPNIITILRSSSRLNSLISDKYMVDRSIKDNKKVSFMSDIYQYVLNIANGAIKKNKILISDALDVSTLDLNSFKPTNGTTSGSTVTGDGATGGVEQQEAGDGYVTTFSVGTRKYNNYQQWQGSYADIYVANNFYMRSEGCALTALAVIASGYGTNVTPGDVANLVNSGQFTYGEHEAILSYYIKRNCHYEYTNVQQNIVNQLKSGKPCMVETGAYSTMHFLTVLAISEDGQQVYISDVGSSSTARNGWKPISFLDRFRRCMIID